MTVRLTPTAVAWREVKRWTERREKLYAELADVEGRIEQWTRVHDELAQQQQQTDSEPAPSPLEELSA